MPELTPLDIHGRIEEVVRNLEERARGYYGSDAVADLRLLLHEIESRFVACSEPLAVPCDYDPERSGVLVEAGPCGYSRAMAQGLPRANQAIVSVWDNSDDEGHAAAYLSPESAMQVGRWLCNWAGTRLTANREEVAAGAPA